MAIDLPLPPNHTFARYANDFALNFKYSFNLTGPESLVVRASACGAVGRGFASRSRHICLSS